MQLKMLRDTGRDWMPKRCSRCKKMKALAEFNRDNHRKDGRQTWCRECASAARLERMTLKTCNKCGVEKRHKSFHKNGGMADGRQATCIVCRKIGYASIPNGCINCAFLAECRHNIRRMSFDPYCFVTSKYHDFYVKEYRVSDEMRLTREIT